MDEPNVCPQCGSTNTDVEQTLEYSGSYLAFDEWRCFDCNCEWENLFSFDGKEILE